MNFEEIVERRRSIRHYKDTPLDTDKVRHAIELASLAPNSSNMQLWEFYHVTDKETLKQLGEACFSQEAAVTAQQMVVFVTRKDLFKKRAKKMLELEKQNILENSPKDRHEARIKNRKKYYGTVMPFLYSNFHGLIGLFRKSVVSVAGLFRPIYHQVTENDMKVVVHKSCALAAQTFMLAMVDLGYDTCPMEGFDSRKVKKILNLPSKAGINMIISCGIRDEKGVRGDRIRVPFEDVYSLVD